MIGVAVVACSPLLPVLVAVSQPLIAAFLIERLAENLGTEKGKDKVAACMDQAEKDARSCGGDASKLCCGLDIIAAGLCLDAWLLEAAGCLVS